MIILFLMMNIIIFTNANTINLHTSQNAGNAPSPSEQDFVAKMHQFKHNNYQNEFVHPDYLNYCQLKEEKICFSVNKVSVMKTKNLDCQEPFLEVFFEYKICEKDFKCAKYWNNGYLHSKPQVHINETKGIKSNNSCKIVR
jgi:hypothetical protein